MRLLVLTALMFRRAYNRLRTKTYTRRCWYCEGLFPLRLGPDDQVCPFDTWYCPRCR